MNKIKFLHISDGHFPEIKDDRYKFNTIIRSLFNTLEKERNEECEIDFIFFTGDIALKGKDYSSANQFFDKLLEVSGLKEKLGDEAKKRIFIVPGNHDVYRNSTKFLQRTLSDKEDAIEFFNPETHEKRKNHFERFKYFSEFYNKYFKRIRVFSHEKHWFSEIHSLETKLGKLKVGIVGLNSAWFAQDDFDKNRLWIGERTVRLAFDEIFTDCKPEIVFTLHHHPYDWLHPEDKKIVKGIITKNSDIVLTGHLHEIAAQQIIDASGGVFHIQSGALYNNSKYPKCIILGTIDVLNNQMAIKPLTYVEGPHDLWTVDPSIFPNAKNYEKIFPWPRKLSLKRIKDEVNKCAPKKLDPLILKKYKRRLKELLKKDKIDRFINLGVESRQQIEFAMPSIQTKEKKAKIYSIFELPEKYKNKVIAIVGEPGAGKTTLLRELVLSHISKRRKQLPVFVRMGVYSQGKEIIDLLDLKEFDKNIVNQFLIDGALLIIWDGVNEAPRSSIDDVFNDLLEFMNKYHKNKFFLSCRSSEFPDWVQEYIIEMNVLPVTRIEIKKQFEKILGVPKGKNIFNQIELHEGHTKMKELCQNPLLLKMLLSIYHDSDKNEINIVNSRANLYQRFLKKLEHREHKKRKPTNVEKLVLIGFQTEILELIAYELQNIEAVYASEKTLQELVMKKYLSSNWEKWWPYGKSPSFYDLFQNIIRKPPLKSVQIEKDEPRLFSFLHQSFGEYYAASFIKNKIEHGHWKFSNLDKHIFDGTRRQWEMLTLLSGILTKPTDLITYIENKATEERNQSLLVLAGQCVRDAANINCEEADDVKIRIIEAFKYWDIPFDYELIYVLKQVNSVSSPYFPKRLSDDIDYFSEKYVQVLPVEFKFASLKTLINYLFSPNINIAINAAYTLGKKKFENTFQKHEVLEVLLDRLTSSSQNLKEQIIVTLKELADPLSVGSLLKIISDDSESPRARAYSLNALGKVGDLKTAPCIIDYLSNHNNPYRDSASWSLQALGKIAMSKDPELLNVIKETYFKALISETNDCTGIYAKGNIIYSLSMLHAIEYRDSIIEWIKTEKEPYVLEDAINAIGILGGKDSEKVISRYLTNSDPLIKIKAIEALVKMRNININKNLNELLNDPFRIVREVASKAIKTLSTK